MFGLFRSPPLVDEDSARWMIDVFSWAQRNFDADYFHCQTQLVQPTNAHFPGRADSVEAMAQNLFDKTLAFAGLNHWRCHLLDQRTLEQLPPPELIDTDGQRGHNRPQQSNARVTIAYNPQQINDPQTLVASFATVLGSYLASTATEPAPADQTQWPLIAELLGVYLGFGVMFANSAFAFKAGCGGCRTPAHSRTAYLSQDEATFALALFCAAKQIPPSQVTPHLKSHLRGLFKRAVKDLSRQTARLQPLLPT